jgi:peroxiredoxin
MKKLFLTAALLALTVFGALAQDFKELGAKLEEYFVSLAGESPAVQNKECDFLIESAKDSLVRQYVALKIYEHYSSSKIMGDEAVAVHIVDKWLAPGKVKMKTEEDLLAAKMYAEFNRSSLIGKNAPKLSLKTPDGKASRIPLSGRYNVLFFYDTSCPACKAETVNLRHMLRADKYDVKLFAIYVGDDADSWISYRNDFPEAIHLWDPKMESDWQRLYGVLGTPRMFLVDPQGIIIGRNLDTPALKVLLSREFSDGKYTYGEESQTARYRQMFATYGDTLKVSHILEIADYLAARTFGEGNIDSFKQVEGDLLYYLSQEKGEVYKDAIIPFVKRYIKMEDVWNTPEDKAQVVSLGEFLSDMTSRTPVGSQVPDIAASGTLRRKPFPIFVKGSKEGVYQLGKLKGKPSYIVFYSANCSSCQELLGKVEELVSGSRKVKVLLVDMDKVPQKDQLLDTFDLTQLPFVIQLDKKGVVQHRYVQL